MSTSVVFSKCSPQTIGNSRNAVKMQVPGSPARDSYLGILVGDQGTCIFFFFLTDIPSVE